MNGAGRAARQALLEEASVNVPVERQLLRLQVSRPRHGRAQEGHRALGGRLVGHVIDALPLEVDHLAMEHHDRPAHGDARAGRAAATSSLRSPSPRPGRGTGRPGRNTPAPPDTLRQGGRPGPQSASQWVGHHSLFSASIARRSRSSRTSRAGCPETCRRRRSCGFLEEPVAQLRGDQPRPGVVGFQVPVIIASLEWAGASRSLLETRRKAAGLVPAGFLLSYAGTGSTAACYARRSNIS